MVGIYYRPKYLQKLVEVVVKAMNYERCKIISDDGNNIKLASSLYGLYINTTMIIQTLTL